MSTPQTVGDEMGVKKTSLLKTTEDMRGVVPFSLFKINISHNTNAEVTAFAEHLTL